MSSHTCVAAGGLIRLLPAVLLLIGTVGAAMAVEPELGFSQRFEADGLSLDAAVSRITPDAAGEHALRAGEAVKVRFDLSDLTGKPLTGAFPNGWMVLRHPAGARAGDGGRCRCALPAGIAAPAGIEPVESCRS
jgi:hypothetical protein